MKLRMRAFKAIDDPETCKRFLDGHVKVLQDYGITNITTNNSGWMKNPSVYGIVVESIDGKEIYGGIRVHLVDGTHHLPVEDAIGKLDSKIYDLIKRYSEDGGTGELCGLWNAKSVAGYGVSLLLIRAGISIVNQVDLKALFTICADYTMPMVRKVGFTVEDKLGTNGEFIYPNENYIARVLRRMNAITLDSAEELDRERMFSLRMMPVQTVIEIGPKGDVEIEYQLIIPTKL